MKKLLLFLFVTGMTSTAVAQQQSEDVISLSEPVEKTAEYEVYGSEFDAQKEATSLGTLVSKSDAFQKKEVVTEGTIKQVCQKKGCFFMLSDGENKARITFKDYSFFIPTNSAGKKVSLTGIFNVKKLSEEKARHYAKDAGENPDEVKGAQEEYSLVATSVKIMK